MEVEQALQIYKQMIEQAMSQGMFKKFESLDAARDSLNSLVQFVSSKNSDNGKSSNATGKEGTGKESTGEGGTGKGSAT